MTHFCHTFQILLRSVLEQNESRRQWEEATKRYLAERKLLRSELHELDAEVEHMRCGWSKVVTEWSRIEAVCRNFESIS